MSPNFDDDDLAPRLEALSDDERDALAFGVIRLDPALRVTYYSRAEALQSGRGLARTTLGLPFFDDVAPCMGTPEVRGRIDAARRDGTLDLEVDHVGDFADRTRRLTLRAVSAADGGVWLAVRRGGS